MHHSMSYYHITVSKTLVKTMLKGVVPELLLELRPGRSCATMRSDGGVAKVQLSSPCTPASLS